MYSTKLLSAIFVDFDIFQPNNSIMYPAYYHKMQMQNITLIVKQ